MRSHWTPFLACLLNLFSRQSYSQPIDHHEHNGIAIRSPQTNTAIYWYTEVTIGNQKFNLTVDTGSSDLYANILKEKEEG